MIRHAPLFILIALAMFPAAAFAQQDVSARLNRLENEIQTLSRALFRNEMPAPDAMQDMAGGGAGSAAQANLELRVSQLERELATLTGKIEQQNFEMRQMQENIEKALADLESRPAMQGFNTKLQTVPQQQTMSMTEPAQPEAVETETPVTGQLGSLTQTPDGTFTVSGNTPADAYEQAFALLRDKNYDAAEKSFADFLTRYPNHDLAANAKYWLGETFYVRGNFERAARVFAEAYQLYPKGPKGPDNLLKLALSLNGLGKKKDACLTLAQLKREYPAGAGPVLARAEREAANLGCE